MKDFYDTVIIGGGPAGSTFARIAAESGISMLLIDGGCENGKPCGGLLAPDAQKVLAGFDLTLPRDVLADPQIFAVKTIDIPTKKIRYYSRMYLNMDRAKFDRWLLSLIPDTVDRINGRCRHIEKSGGEFTVTFRSEASVHTVRCRRIVGADGANSIVRRTFFPCDIMHYVAIQQWFDSDKIKRSSHNEKALINVFNPFYSCIFDPETSESCSWSINKDNYFIYGGSFAPEKCRAMFERQKQRFEKLMGVQLGKPLRTEACKVLRPRKLTDFQTGGEDIFLIGEAAGFISPSSFEGISSAMKSGRLLAAAFRSGSPQLTYRRSVRGIKLRLYLKCFKRYFMYTPFLRRLVMGSGATSIKVEERKNPYGKA